MNIKSIRKMSIVAVVVAVVVVMLGAYTRLTDAGLGCPDWPGCYGFLGVPQTAEHIAIAEQAFPERPVEPHKAWNEMIHRYFASTLGLMILIIFIFSLLNKEHHRPIKHPLFLLILVIFQGALGMWTVTMNLNPLIVMGHLLGGFSTLSLLYLLILRLTPYRIPGGDSAVRPLLTFGIVALVVLVLQIALGGWTAANYAATACTQLPICEADWVTHLNVKDAFSMETGLHSYEFGVLNYDAAMTIHVFHRLGAIITALVILTFAVKLYKKAASSFFRKLASLLAVVLFIQFALGVSNIWFQLPIGVAVLHNIVAVGLVVILLTILYSISRKT
ncbi:MAG: cytochrome c oxidase assembly protein subunit 15 [Phenylobacterium sp.]